MSDRQADLFSGGGFRAEPDRPASAGRLPADWTGADGQHLIDALADAGLADTLAIVAEIRRRGLRPAVPALERLCRRFRGFGLHSTIPEQTAALEALAQLGGDDAARAVARLIDGGAVRGPGLGPAMRTAASLGAVLVADSALRLLRDDDPAVRADACRCLGGRPPPPVLATLVDLLDDLHAPVRLAAACALGRAGRREARGPLVANLREAPSPEVVEALATVADEDCIVLLGRLARQDATLRTTVLAALDAIDHPRAATVAAGLGSAAPGTGA